MAFKKQPSTAGIQSGIAAGTKVVAVTWANTFPQKIEQVSLKIQDFREVNEKWIEQHLDQ
jgi:beta-phosphoglucomutase-like phosphatase (HAD superfamily)